MRRTGSSIALLCLLAGCAGETPAPALPGLRIDPERVAVAGISAGAYMAQQVHFALNDRIHGAALIAGGPYGCAGGELQTALDACVNPVEAPDVVALATRARARAQAGMIAPIENFADDRVWIFRGARDPTVGASVTQASAAIYRELAPAISMVTDFEQGFGHVFPTVDAGADCVEGGSPWLGRCNFDAAATLVAAVFGAVDVDPAQPAQGRGRVQTFDQRKYFAADADPVLADEGLLYVPPQCEDARCGLLLAFHGCQQSATQIGQVFVTDSGLNRAADAASLVVIYPQTRATWLPLNPRACWDWWGYSGPNYDTRDGAQIRFVANLLDAVGV